MEVRSCTKSLLRILNRKNIDNSNFQGSHIFPRLLGQYEPSSIHHVRCRGLDPPAVDGILQYPGDA